MTPIEYLRERFQSVNSALGETLRQDYGPGVSNDYYGECERRLAAIGKAIARVKPANIQSISVYLSQLDQLSYWICLIERSQLGSFSWPFAFSLKRMAVELLSEPDLAGDIQKPLIHIVADGEGYLIDFEDVVPPIDAKQKFIVIAFPRTLKHHVLLHTIFAHELGHAALHSENCKAILQSQIIIPFMSSGPCSDKRSLTSWLHDTAAPPDVKQQLIKYKYETGIDFEFNDDQYDSWIIELFCDLFGLILFGPSFLAAHKAILQAAEASAYECNLSTATHPPYSVRNYLLVDTFRLLGWNTPIIDPADSELYDAEKRFLNYLTNNSFSTWSKLIDDSIVQGAIQCLQSLFSKYPDLSYSAPRADSIKFLLNRLISRLPPIQESISQDGNPKYEPTHITHSMYAGWIYWISKDNFSTHPLSFTLINRLCDQSLLQQEAINRVFYPGLIK